MDAPDKPFPDLAGLLRSWIPWQSEPSNVSRDFWMPDQSCRVCYECDSQFTVFNRRHHCRLCGRVFCAKCTSNSIPAPSGESRTTREERERIRVCNYCFKLCEQRVTTTDNGAQAPRLDLSTSPSAASLASTKSSGTANSSSITFGSAQYPVGPYQRVSYSPGFSPNESSAMELISDEQGAVESGSSYPVTVIGDQPPHQFGFFTSRSDDDEDVYAPYHSDTETQKFTEDNVYEPHVEYGENVSYYGSNKMHPDGETVYTEILCSSPVDSSFNLQNLDDVQEHGKNDERDVADENESSSSLYARGDVSSEPVDFENNGLLWLPPEPDNEDDEKEAEKEAVLFDDDDEGDAVAEWGYLRASSSFGSGEHGNKGKSSEEHKWAMKRVVDGHFRALISQLLQVENLPVSEDDGNQSWLEIITSLSWEAITLLKPDMSKGGGGMDPGGYVKVKCIASGHRCESMVLKGVVCKKNVAHRRMISKIEKPRMLILGGALEYHRVANILASVDTLLKQEMDHLKMAVAKIGAQHPDVLLVEKTVSRHAQDYLHAKDISLILNIKRPLLERIARCTGAQIAPSIDHLSSQKLGYCDIFHVERFLEEHGSAGQGGKKLVKTFMFFEGCPKPLGCTILLRGANGDELKKVKHVVQYGIFAAYHLALETSFLADEGASLPEFPLNSPLTVALPDKPNIHRSISTIPGFTVSALPESQGPQSGAEPQRCKSSPTYLSSMFSSASDAAPSFHLPDGFSFPHYLSNLSSEISTSSSVIPSFEEQKSHDSTNDFLDVKSAATDQSKAVMTDQFTNSGLGSCETMGQALRNISITENSLDTLDGSSLQHDTQNYLKEPMSSKEEFPPSPSDHQSILVSLSSRCVWKGTVCERSHLFRIKYYGSFDKPLGRYLRDHLFDQGHQCRSCNLSSEAHVECYTHQQGTLTISVKELSEFLLPGERDGKIWMWHRCLRCPRINGFPPATRRIVMSDAAWGLSFGKFLELSFSNHAAASRVASCGHSLHRDCLRFYGFGKMVACFRYASIDVHSVYLPPPKLDFHCENKEWMVKETSEVVDRAELLFTEVLNALRQIAEKKYAARSVKSGLKLPDVKRQIAELEGMLQWEKTEFEELIQKILRRDTRNGQPDVDILEINRLRRQLIFQSYVWDHRLILAAKANDSGLHDSLTENAGEHHANNENIIEANMPFRAGKGSSSSDSLPVGAKSDEQSNQGEGIHSNQGEIDQGADKGRDEENGKVDKSGLVDSINLPDQTEPLESGLSVRRALSEGQFPVMANLSDTLEKAWTGGNHAGVGMLNKSASGYSDSSSADIPPTEKLDSEVHGKDAGELKETHSLPSMFYAKGTDGLEDSVIWPGMPFLNFYQSLNKNIPGSAQKLETVSEYTPVYVPSLRDLEPHCGARLLLPVGLNETVIPVYDDEPTSIISYALLTPEYHAQLSDKLERHKDNGESAVSLPQIDPSNLQGLHSFEESSSDSHRNPCPADESLSSVSGSRTSLSVDPLTYTKALHARVSFSDDSPLGKVKYTVICYCAKQFESLRRICCPSELNFVSSLSRCKKWGAQGGKSNVFFAKTLDDRFIIKQVTKTELESFMKFASEYFKYLSESVGTGSPTCLAKILGIYQVTSKHLKGGKETKMDVLVMENLVFGRSITRLYDLKGSSRSRYNPDSSGTNKVLLDQNLIEAMPTSPIFVGNKAKRALERAVWNDTNFLASVDVMDYSLLVGVDEEKHELVLGIIDFMRQYTWDKHLETWVKTSGILGGPKNSSPTVISPMQYKKRFRKAMTMYFLMVPDQWSPLTILPSKSQSDICKDDIHGCSGTTT